MKLGDIALTLTSIAVVLMIIAEIYFLFLLATGRHEVKHLTLRINKECLEPVK